MLYSTATGYALRALTVLPEDGSYALTKQLAAQLELPGPYLAKILQVLVQKGLLRSLRGPRGGFQLARPALIAQADDAFRQTRAAIGLDGVGSERGKSPAVA